MGNRKYIGTVGDCNPIEYGGGIVLREGDKKSHLLIHFTEISEREQWDPRIWWVHIIDLDPDFLDWIDFDELSAFTGVTADEYRSALKRGPLAIADVVIDAAYCFGFGNFDDNPFVMTKTEINKYWKRWI